MLGGSDNLHCMQRELSIGRVVQGPAVRAFAIMIAGAMQDIQLKYRTFSDAVPASG